MKSENVSPARAHARFSYACGIVSFARIRLLSPPFHPFLLSLFIPFVSSHCIRGPCIFKMVELMLSINLWARCRKLTSEENYLKDVLFCFCVKIAFYFWVSKNSFTNLFPAILNSFTWELTVGFSRFPQELPIVSLRVCFIQCTMGQNQVILRHQ